MGKKNRMSLTTISWVRDNEWELKAKATDAAFDAAWSLGVFNDKLYAGGGYVLNDCLYEWNGIDAWKRVAPGTGGNFIISLVVYNGKLYGDSSADTLLEWNGTNAWVAKAAGVSTSNILVCNNRLFAGGDFTGGLYRWNDVNAWVQVAPQIGATQISRIIVFNDALYGVATGGRLYRWNNADAWVEVLPSTGTMTAPVVYNGKLYWISGDKLVVWNGGISWTTVAQLPVNVTATAVYHEKLYMGGSDGGLYEWDGVGWLKVASSMIPVDVSVVIRALALYHDNLYAGMQITTPQEAQLWEWTSFSISQTKRDENTNSSITVTDSTCVRVSHIRHVTTLAPWIV